MFVKYNDKETKFARTIDEVAGNTETSLQKLKNTIRILNDSPVANIFGFFIGFKSRNRYVKKYYGIDGTELILILIERNNRQIKCNPEIPLSDYMSIFKSSLTLKWEKKKHRNRKRTQKAYGAIVQETTALKRLKGYVSPPASIEVIEEQINSAKNLDRIERLTN